VRLAQGFDAFDALGLPYFAPDRPRVADPWERRRLARYLSDGGRLAVRADSPAVDPLAPDLGAVVPISYRTDGVWVWQEALAYYLREYGIGPEPDLLARIRQNDYWLPEIVPDELLREAVELVFAPDTDPVPPPTATYYASGARRVEAAEGPVFEELDPDLRWRPVSMLPAAGLREISQEQAAALLNERCAERSHEIGQTLRLARSFDAVSPSGEPFFSPDWPRVADRSGRERLARYLSSGLAVAGHRTDGRWVWPESLAGHAQRGVAPEWDLLLDIAERGYQPPRSVPAEAVSRAERLLHEPVTAAERTEATYFAKVNTTHPAHAPLSLMRQLTTSAGVRIDQAIHRDLRWHETRALARNRAGGEYDFVELTEQEAAAVLDRWCEAWSEERMPSAASGRAYRSPRSSGAPPQRVDEAIWRLYEDNRT
jgi:hypothetical protein